MQAQDVVVVGRIGAPYGLKGWVRVSSFTEPSENITVYEPWLLEVHGGWQVHHPVEVKPYRQGYVARFADVGDRDKAVALTGKLVAVARAQLPQLDPDEYYWRDLEGLAVWNRGDRLGVVDHLIDTGATPVLVVRDDAGDGSSRPQETLIAFTEQFVLKVDLPAGRIEVDWPGEDEAD